MKCKNCDGKGVVPYRDFNGNVVKALGTFTCMHCNGIGEIEQTNEEYLRSCNTEQLAEFIADVCYELVDDICANYDDTSCDYRQTEKDYWTKWLKQPHNKE